MKPVILMLGLALVAQPISERAHAEPAAMPHQAAHPFARHIAEAAQRFDIPEAWIKAVMRAESSNDPAALSSAGAMGLMQVMPATWQMLTARFGLGQNPYEPRANIHAGAAYLRMMWNRYGDVSAMLAAYNAGPKRADAWVARKQSLPAETVAYVAKIATAIGPGPSSMRTIDIMPDPFAWRRATLFAAPPAPASDGDKAEASDAKRQDDGARQDSVFVTLSRTPRR
ncbi:lytic transglycosylase domain-containing protein [Sphingopyxis sp. R3-92]|uniref:lytic transglycosylase domain-containing protein n=1 Tax=Sphingopyxis sp. R3-92 TaxID=3158553 RepID=UPI003EE79686